MMTRREVTFVVLGMLAVLVAFVSFHQAIVSQPVFRLAVGMSESELTAIAGPPEAIYQAGEEIPKFGGKPVSVSECRVLEFRAFPKGSFRTMVFMQDDRAIPIARDVN
jgi:hypothetical protein